MIADALSPAFNNESELTFLDVSVHQAKNFKESSISCICIRNPVT
jgi:hypothetical protein